MNGLLQKGWVFFSVVVFGCMLPSQAAVTVFFEQEDDDVRVSWDGTLAVSLSVSDCIAIDQTPVVLTLSSSQFFARNGGSNQRICPGAGVQFPTGAADFSSLSGPGSAPGVGFDRGLLLHSIVHVTGGTGGAVSELTFIPTRDTFLLEGTTLDELNATGFLNTLAWTANETEDTISFTAGSVPEPSSLLLSSLGVLILILKRNRCGIS